MALTETDFITIKEKMNKIHQRLNGLYQNWQAEYKRLSLLNNVKKFSNSMSRM